MRTGSQGRECLYICLWSPERGKNDGGYDFADYCPDCEDWKFDLVKEDEGGRLVREVLDEYGSMVSAAIIGLVIVKFLQRRAVDA